MIIVKLWGGLGNQMFQYATARRLAAKHHTKVGLDLSWFTLTNNQDSTRFFELNYFKLKKNVIKHPEKIKTILFEPRRLSAKNLLKRRYRNLNEFILYREQQYSLNKVILRASNNSFLEGNWTTDKYFRDVRSTILADFKYQKKPDKKNADLIQKLKKSPSCVSLHIRRGDFLNPETLKHHGALGLDYYEQAEKMIEKNIANPIFYIFSDDHNWVKSNLKLKNPMVFVTHNKKGVEDMRLMRNCKHNIIANSTFSWWGAWLNENPGKTVIAPKKWLTDPKMDTSDVIPKEWVKI